MTSFSLRQVKLRPGEEHREPVEIELPAFEFGGQRYIPVPEKVTADFVINRANTGTVFSIAFDVRLHGPCYRCLGDAVLDLSLHAREYQVEQPPNEPGDDQLATPYLENGNLDLSSWARDVVALALPDKILCSLDCAGLCPQCGKNLNDEPHTHEETVSDSRWAALEALRESL